MPCSNARPSPAFPTAPPTRSLSDSATGTFSHVLAFSPGVILSEVQRGKPRVFVSHGDADEILPIARCGRPIAARLERAGYDVLYREFDGGHAVPGEVMTEAMAWFAGP